jgi:hypothetical protein
LRGQQDLKDYDGSKIKVRMVDFKSKVLVAIYK